MAVGIEFGQRAVMIFAFMMCACGCSGPLNSRDVPGQYQAKYAFGDEALTINPDGTFVQNFVIRNGSKVSAKLGSWLFDQKHGMIDLHSYRIISDGYCNRDTEMAIGTGSLPVERQYFLFGRMRLGPDAGCPYWKLN